MKVFFILALSLALASASVIDPNDSLNDEEFREEFNLPEITDPEEQRAHEEALEAAEQEVKEVNEAFLAHNASWFDEINELSDVPADMWTEHAGRILATGRIDPAPEDRYNAESERYFDQFRYSRAAVPDSYSAVDEGLVTPVRNQGNCGSCVAFATAANVETCFKKVTGVFGDYSEQHMLDCGRKYKGAAACRGAATHSYTDWLADKKVQPASEEQYPYIAKQQKCSKPMPSFDQGANITGSYITYRANEELLKQMVYEHGTVVGSVVSSGPFSRYSKGIFAGCTDHNRLDHCIAVVGYGSEGGVDYWLIKNSWGTNWGENGYIRLQRGVNMCGIGKEIALVTCGRSDGTAVAPSTAAPTTTKAPCKDQFKQCRKLAKWGFCDYFEKECNKSCKRC